MVTAILNQNNAIENYILELNLPYSSALKNHMVNLISVITVTEVSKNLSSIYPSLLVIGMEVQVQGFWTHTNVIMSMSMLNEYFMLYLKSQMHQMMMILDF
jgi:hypothetical protein